MRGTAYVGGIVRSLNDFSIKNCINIGGVVGTSNVGAITGYADILFGGATVSNCFYLKNDTTNLELTGIYGVEDSQGQVESKKDFFEQELNNDN